MRSTLREICGNDPAVAIKAFIDSLSNQDRVPWLNLRYTTFKDVDSGICYGCAATYTVLNLLSPKSPIEPIYPYIFKNDRQYAKYLKCDFEDLSQFEDAIDRFRIGLVNRLAAYFNTELPEPDEDWHLHDDRALDDLPLIQNYYDRLIKDRVTV